MKRPCSPPPPSDIKQSFNPGCAVRPASGKYSLTTTPCPACQSRPDGHRKSSQLKGALPFIPEREHDTPGGRPTGAGHQDSMPTVEQEHPARPGSLTGGAGVQAAEAAAADRRRASLQGELARRSLRRSSVSHKEPAAGSSSLGASAGQAHKGASPEPARQYPRSLSRQTSRPASSSSAAAQPQAPARAQTPGQPSRPGTAAAGEQTPGFRAAKARCRACLNYNHVHSSVSNRQTVNGTMPRQGNCGTHSLCGVKRADQPCMAQVHSEPWACSRRVGCTHGIAGLPPALPATVCQPFCVPGQCWSGPVSPATHLQASVCTAQSASGQARPAPDAPD